MTASLASQLNVVIPTRGRWEILARTLSALRAQTVSGFEVTVVVDGIDQRPPRMDHVNLIVRPRGGPGAARNAGVTASRRPLVLFLGDDMVPDPDLVARHLQRHADLPAPEHAVLGHVEWHPEIARSRLIRWLETSATQFDFLNIEGDQAGWGRFYSCNVSLKREFFLSIGGFDEEFAFDYEDLDIGYRLNEKGMVLWYERAAVARHFHRYDLESLARRYESHAAGERLMSRKHPWFTPYFCGLVYGAERRRKVSPLWLLIEDSPLRNLGPVGRISQERNHTWFLQQLASSFLARWEGEEDLSDLRAYLGDGFDIRLLWGHRQAVDDEEFAASDEQSFYRTSEMYLYDLTAFALMGVKRPYLGALRRHICPGATVLDYGCGIGSDGLRLIQAGYKVAFCDFDNPSTRYLRWRLEQRGCDAPVYDLDGEVPGGFDAVYAFDVIEHVDDPFGFLEELESRAEVVFVNLLEHDPDDTHLHHPLPIKALIEYATRKGLLHYRRYHSNSHLIAYSSTASGQLTSKCERLVGSVAFHRNRFHARARRILVP